MIQNEKKKSKIFVNSNKRKEITLNERRICNNTRIFTKWLSSREKNYANCSGNRKAKSNSFGLQNFLFILSIFSVEI